jgi:Family of unknown function (DUF6134)
VQIPRRRNLLCNSAALLMGVFGGCAQAADPQALSSRTLIATRNGKEIGTETITIERRPERLLVTLGVHLHVMMLGVTIYRFDQDSTEAWGGDKFERLTSQTSVNGVQHRVEVSRQATSLQMQADRTDLLIDEASLPASQWYEPHFERATLIHNVDGHLLHVTAQRVGSEKIQVGAALIEVRHYRFSGDVTDDFWFDADGVLVQRRLIASDHSVVQFTMAPNLSTASLNSSGVSQTR